MKKSVLAVVFVVAVLAVLRPWTIVPLRTATPQAFDPAAYVASIWESRVLPVAETSALDLQAFLAGHVSTGTARAVFVTGTARISTVDRTSRVGLAYLVRHDAGARTAAIQIGPVLRGTAVRDALDFIRFTDFVNQLEFAAVAGALNDRVLSGVLSAPPGIVPGAEVTVVGAVPATSTAQTVEVVPVRLTVAGARR